MLKKHPQSKILCYNLLIKKGSAMPHEHHHHHKISNEKAIKISFFLTFSFMIIEVIGGLLSGSLALIADAGHMLTDAAALALAWAGFYFGRKSSNGQKTFGYFRLEVLAALINALTLIGLTVWIGVEAVERFENPVEVMAVPMFAVAVIGLLVNCFVFLILTKSNQEHINIKSALLHVLGDLLGSIGAIAAAIIIYLTGWFPIDPLLSILMCVLILKGAWQVLNNALHILMEGTPQGIDIKEIEKSLKKIKNVESICHIHIWSITTGKPMATLNVILKDEKDIIKTIVLVKKKLAEDFGIDHSTIEVGTNTCSLK